MMVACALGLLVCGCAHGGRAASSKSKVPAARVDTTAALIAKADAHLDAGMAEMRQGHLNRARAEFDESLGVYLGTPGGAMATPQLGEAYRRTLRAI